MPALTVEIPEVVARRLEALASASGKSVQELARECLDAFAGSFASRRAILKARSDAAKTAGTTFSLADLGWLDGYAGQTVDELLLYEGKDKLPAILASLEQAIQEKVKVQSSLHITGVERTVLSVMALNREVNNGGYDQYFRNSSRRYARSIVADLTRIGCQEIADITQRALDSLHLPEMSLAAIEAAMREQSPERDRVLERCNIAFYENSSLLECLFGFVKKYQVGIRI